MGCGPVSTAYLGGVPKLKPTALSLSRVSFRTLLLTLNPGSFACLPPFSFRASVAAARCSNTMRCIATTRCMMSDDGAKWSILYGRTTMATARISHGAYDTPAFSRSTCLTSPIPSLPSPLCTQRSWPIKRRNRPLFRPGRSSRQH